MQTKQGQWETLSLLHTKTEPCLPFWSSPPFHHHLQNEHGSGMVAGVWKRTSSLFPSPSTSSKWGLTHLHYCPAKIQDFPPRAALPPCSCWTPPFPDTSEANGETPPSAIPQAFSRTSAKSSQCKISNNTVHVSNSLPKLWRINL